MYLSQFKKSRQESENQCANMEKLKLYETSILHQRVRSSLISGRRLFQQQNIQVDHYFCHLITFFRLAI